MTVSIAELEARPRLHLGFDDHGRELSDEEYRNAAFDVPWRYELLDGRLSVMPPCGQGHVEREQPWLRRLFAYSDQRPDLVEFVVPEAWVMIHDGRYRIGDLGVYLHGDRSNTPIPDRVPELMVEIVSPGRTSHDRDYQEKKVDYFQAGVLEYVIVDPIAWRVQVLTRGETGYVERVLKAGETYTTPLLPGLEVVLNEVL